MVGDLLGSVGAIAAALGIMATGWTVLDPALSVLVAGLVIRSAWGLVADAVRVLSRSRRRASTRRVAADLVTLPGIAEVGHFHAWPLTDRSHIATAHVTPQAGTDPLTLPRIVAARLHERHGIDHATVQVDPPGGIAPTPH